VLGAQPGGGPVPGPVSSRRLRTRPGQQGVLTSEPDGQPRCAGLKMPAAQALLAGQVNVQGVERPCQGLDSARLVANVDLDSRSRAGGHSIFGCVTTVLSIMPSVGG